MAELRAENESTIVLSVNLDGLLSAALCPLQRSIDILSFARAGAQTASRAAYESNEDFIQLEPAQNFRLAFEEVRGVAEDWFTLHALRDSIDIVGAFLEEVRLSCAILELSKIERVTLQEFNKAHSAGLAFHKLGLPLKLKKLEKLYGVSTELAAHVISLNDVRNCLVHRLGIVSHLDINGDEMLSVSWRSIVAEVTGADGARVEVREPIEISGAQEFTVRTDVRSKTFAIGERVAFTYSELTGILYSLILFSNAFCESVQACFGSIEDGNAGVLHAI